MPAPHSGACLEVRGHHRQETEYFLSGRAIAEPSDVLLDNPKSHDAADSWLRLRRASNITAIAGALGFLGGLGIALGIVAKTSHSDIGLGTGGAIAGTGLVAALVAFPLSIVGHERQERAIQIYNEDASATGRCGLYGRLTDEQRAAIRRRFEPDAE